MVEEDSTQLERITPEQLHSQQLTDSTLVNIRKHGNKEGSPFLWAEVLLKIKRKPYRKGRANRIVVPKAYRTEILRMVHCSPTAGHFGQARTLDTIEDL